MWGECSGTCGEGNTQIETRTIKWQPRNNGTACQDDQLERTRTCNDDCCRKYIYSIHFYINISGMDHITEQYNPVLQVYIDISDVTDASLLSFLLCLVEILFAVFHLEQIFELFHRWDIIFFVFSFNNRNISGRVGSVLKKEKLKPNFRKLNLLQQRKKKSKKLY